MQVLFSSEEMQRYRRHLSVPEVGTQGQYQLKQAKVLCVGAGGLGAPIGLYLAAAGVGKLGIVDFDRVDASNLQRQVQYDQEDLGKSKALATAARLKKMNPHIEVIGYDDELDLSSAMRLFKEYDLVVDGTDNFSTRYLINDVSIFLRKPVVYGSVFRFEGQVSVFGLDQGPCYRCLYPEPPEYFSNCSDAGVLGVLPGIIGTIQAAETIKVILNRPGTLSGRLLVLDASDMTFNEIKISKNAACPSCSNVAHLLERLHSSHEDEDEQPLGMAPEIDVYEFKQRTQSGEPTLVLDVREPREYKMSNMNGLLIPLDTLPKRLDEISKDQFIVVHCATGVRSKTAVTLMRKAGFSRVYSLKGGICAWQNSESFQGSPGLFCSNSTSVES